MIDTEYLRVMQKETGHELTVSRTQYAFAPEAYELLEDQDATDAGNNPLPPMYTGAIPEPTTNDGAIPQPTTNAGNSPLPPTSAAPQNPGRLVRPHEGDS